MTRVFAALFVAVVVGCGGSAKPERPDRGVIVGKRVSGGGVMIVNNTTMILPDDYQIRVCPEQGEPFYVTVKKDAYDAAKPGMQWAKEQP